VGVHRKADGTRLGQKVTPLDRVGLYVPGGKASYPSSVLMNAIPAKVAGVGELIMVVPTPRGEKNALVLAAAALAGVDRVFTLGGAQAVAALAYGTQTIPQVDKIVGPGNAYVASRQAARLRRGRHRHGGRPVGGADHRRRFRPTRTGWRWTSSPRPSTTSWPSRSCSARPASSRRVEESIERLLPEMPRRETIATSLKNRGALIHVRDLEEACRIANRIAPEHLELSVADPYALDRPDPPRRRHLHRPLHGRKRWVTTAPGPTTCCRPRAAHASPRRSASTTSRSAPASSRFPKRRRANARQGRVGANLLAHGEGLQAHARSAEMRLKG
jgi:histidinol dehydrogenase